jgi:hypothetical protein
MSGTIITISGNSNDSNLVLGSANSSIVDNGSIPTVTTPNVADSV